MLYFDLISLCHSGCCLARKLLLNRRPIEGTEAVTVLLPLAFCPGIHVGPED